jgi:hypothetical protein
MSNANFGLKGMKFYRKALEESRAKDGVGVHKHLITPQPPTSTLGLRGKPVAKKERAELIEKLWQAALKNPALMPAAMNTMKQWGQCGK